MNLKIKSDSEAEFKIKDDQKFSIEIELMASLRRPAELQRISIQKVIPSTTIQKLLLELKYEESELSIMQVYVNKERVRLNHILDDKDIVFVTIPIGGG